MRVEILIKAFLKALTGQIEPLIKNMTSTTPEERHYKTRYLLFF
jgi:hypothetical protein